MSSIIIYLAIFFAKLIEVSAATLRMVLINRGQKLLGSVIGFFEILIWLYVVNLVLKDVTQDLVKVFVYCLAFSMGNYLGTTIEEKLALGMSLMEVLIDVEKSPLLVSILHKNGYGVSVINSNGVEKKMNIIKIYLKRKSIPDAYAIITKSFPESIISVSDVKTVVGGFIKK